MASLPQRHIITMIDTERFIDEVEKRPCIWDVNDNKYFIRICRKKAWEEIAATFFPNATEETILKEVPELQRKWKHIRDYYVRERRKCGSHVFSNKGKRKKTLLQLAFLDTADERISARKRWKAMAEQEGNQTADSIDIVTVVDDNSSSSVLQGGPPKLTPQPFFTKPRIKMVEPARSPPPLILRSTPYTSSNYNSVVRMNLDENSSSNGGLLDDSTEGVVADGEEEHEQYDAMSPIVHFEEDSDRQFLLSLLPQLRMMGERMNFEFRLQVMNLIRNLRYPSPSAADAQESLHQQQQFQPTIIKDEVILVDEVEN